MKPVGLIEIPLKRLRQLALERGIAGWRSQHLMDAYYQRQYGRFWRPTTKIQKVLTDILRTLEAEQ